MTSVILLALLAPQDLIEREVALRRRLAPAPEMKMEPMRASLELKAAPDFSCGSFDLKTSFRSLYGKNVREEFLGGALSAIQSELAGSALVLACYASPTVCDAIKHYRVSANEMLGMELDACRAVEESLQGVQRESRARSIKECLDDQARQGAPLDEARRACDRATQLQGLDGKPVKEIDLLKDLGLSGTLVAPLKIGAGTLQAESRGTAVAEAYEARRQERLRAWEEALRAPGKELPGPVTRAELDRIAAMEEGPRSAAVRSMAAAQALADLVKEAHAAERALESAELLAQPEVRGEMERRRAQLRNEISRLGEVFESERRVNAAVAEAQAAASAEVARRAHGRLAPRRAGAASDAAAEQLREWGCEVKR